MPFGHKKLEEFFQILFHQLAADERGLDPARWFFRESDETKPETFGSESTVFQLAA
jgi:hypothetical protein